MGHEQIQIILYNSVKRLKIYNDINSAVLKETDFRNKIMLEFKEYTILNGRHLTIKKPTFKAYCGTSLNTVKSLEIDIYGLSGLTEFEKISTKMGWQIFNKHTNRFI